MKTGSGREKWSNCAKRLYFGSKIEIETKVTADPGSPAAEKRLPEWNPRVCSSEEAEK